MIHLLSECRANRAAECVSHRLNNLCGSRTGNNGRDKGNRNDCTKHVENLVAVHFVSPSFPESILRLLESSAAISVRASLRSLRKVPLCRLAFSSFTLFSVFSAFAAPTSWATARP